MAKKHMSAGHYCSGPIQSAPMKMSLLFGLLVPLLLSWRPELVLGNRDEESNKDEMNRATLAPGPTVIKMHKDELSGAGDADREEPKLALGTGANATTRISSPSNRHLGTTMTSNAAVATAASLSSQHQRLQLSSLTKHRRLDVRRSDQEGADDDSEAGEEEEAFDAELGPVQPAATVGVVALSEAPWGTRGVVSEKKWRIAKDGAAWASDGKLKARGRLLANTNWLTKRYYQWDMTEADPRKRALIATGTWTQGCTLEDPLTLHSQWREGDSAEVGGVAIRYCRDPDDCSAEKVKAFTHKINPGDCMIEFSWWPCSPNFAHLSLCDGKDEEEETGKWHVEETCMCSKATGLQLLSYKGTAVPA